MLTACHKVDGKKDGFNKIVSTATGDLDKDGETDKIVVSQDTANDKRPYRLQVFMKGSDKAIVSTEQLIEPAYPDGKTEGEGMNQFDQVTIQKGVLIVSTGMLRGHYEYKFRWQNGHFELIGFTEVISDGQGVVTTVDFNLSTGVRIEQQENYEADTLISNLSKNVIIKPLPTLENVTPFRNELYAP